MKHHIRAAASESDTAQAAAFLAILTRHFAEASLAVESADLAVAEARASNRAAKLRRAVIASENIHAERDELRRQIGALVSRFPSLSAQAET
ncbi:hypothetical protein [Antrihabitans stalactiti]|uniref:Uncharacterized protein n=1 Tax=Antrihabitans stalactiti TaxID=2584121 RepID=A0A848KR34_9NOCA|nr:hypothetical protein [Antrihabitans stalactiti]NMN99042.1 hypothetical protein [Antrihabitans stalactiti]